MTEPATGEICFRGDEAAYLAWVHSNPDGFVLNTRSRRPDPDYLVLHRASCRTVTVPNPRAAPGGFTERGYIKVCSAHPADLARWAARHVQRASIPLSKCKICSPEWIA